MGWEAGISVLPDAGEGEEGVDEGRSGAPCLSSLALCLCLHGILVHYCSLFTSPIVISLSAEADSISYSPNTASPDPSPEDCLLSVYINAVMHRTDNNGKKFSSTTRCCCRLAE